MPEINDAILMHSAADPNNSAAGFGRLEPVRGGEVVDEVWEEKNDKAINIIPCESISFAAGESLELLPGQTKRLDVIQSPVLANIPYLTYESSDLEVIQIIDDCVAYACCEGEATVTASSSDGTELVASVTITVKAKTQEEEGGDEEPEEGKGEFISPVLPEHVYVGEEYEVSVGFKSDVDILGVEFVATTTGPGDATYKMTDSLGQEYSFVNNVTWGNNFDIKAPYEAYSPIKASFSAAGEYTFVTQLRKYDTKEVINEDIASIMVEEKPADEGEEVTTKAKKK